MTQISILGCGWLGLPLAKTLLENGFSIKGSTTSAEKLSVMENLGIQPHLVVLDHEAGKETGNLTGFLENSKILIIDIPPKLGKNSKESSTAIGKTFVEKIQNLIPFIEKSSVENLLFISSTSVYGENNLLVTEETELNPDTESGKQLVQTEQLLQSNSNFKTTVLRFGGLIGENRHPIKFLAGRTNIENPNAPINLIHQEDCIGIILEILRPFDKLKAGSAQNDKLEWNQTFNAVTPFHPSRKEYYTQKAIDLNLELPVFNEEHSGSGKIISSSKIEKVLEYQFARPSL